MKAGSLTDVMEPEGRLWKEKVPLYRVKMGSLTITEELRALTGFRIVEGSKGTVEELACTVVGGCDIPSPFYWVILELDMSAEDIRDQLEISVGVLKEAFGLKWPQLTDAFPESVCGEAEAQTTLWKDRSCREQIFLKAVPYRVVERYLQEHV